MIDKKNLKGKFITYIDKDSKCRTSKVIKVSGSYITVKTAVGSKFRIHKDNIKGRQLPKRGIEKIIW